MRKSLVRKSLLTILAAACIILAAMAFSYISGIPTYYVAPAVALPILLFGRKSLDTFLLILLTTLLAICISEVPYFTPVVFSIVLLLVPICTLMRNGGTLTTALEGLGFRGRTLRTLIIAVASMVPAFFFLLILSQAATYFGIDDAHKVSQKISTLPLYVIIYAITVGPLAEEVFFRSFLTRYVGPIISNLLFAFAHITYGSVYEIVGAFGLGIFLYLLYRLSGDIKTAIWAHMLINLFSIIMMRAV